MKNNLNNFGSELAHDIFKLCRKTNFNKLNYLFEVKFIIIQLYTNYNINRVYNVNCFCNMKEEMNVTGFIGCNLTRVHE